MKNGDVKTRLEVQRLTDFPDLLQLQLQLQEL